MATILDKPLMRETGLKNGEKEVFVILVPGSSGGTLVFKEKGKGGKGAEIDLAKLMSSVLGGLPGESVSSGSDNTSPVSGDGNDPDLVDLAVLEARLMILPDSFLPQESKSRVWEIVRDIREERREDFQEPTIGRGSKRNTGKRMLSEERS